MLLKNLSSVLLQVQYIWTPQGWMPIKDFELGGTVLAFDSTEMLSFGQATFRQTMLAAKYPQHTFKVDVFE